MRSPRVVVGFHHWGMVHAKFAWSLARAIAYEGNRISRVLEFGSPYTDEARNKLIEAFLAVPIIPQPEYFLMVDADIEFEADAISKTMWVAQNFGADVVWGNYALGSFSNSIFKKAENSWYGAYMPDLKPNMVYENIYAGGTGWCLISRQWAMKMKEVYPGPWHWFDRDIVESHDADKKPTKLGEDMCFGCRTWKAGGKQVGYTGVALIHHKFNPIVPQFMTPVMEELGVSVINNINPTGTTTALPETASLGQEVKVGQQGEGAAIIQ